MQINITQSFGEITTKQIQSFESEFEISIPKQYRDFLLKHNGGIPEPAKFSIMDDVLGEFDSTLQCFGGIHDGEYHSLARYLKTHEDRIPKDLLPAASDWFGNQVCLGISEVRLGKVYFWDHEGETDPLDGEEDEEYYDNVYLIAATFDDFIASLYA